MSITISDTSPAGGGPFPEEESGMKVYSSFGRSGYGEEGSSRVRTISSMPRRPAREARRSRNPLRRLQGFLIETHGEESRVAIEEDGQLVEYFFPAKLLKENNVTLKNQPFELDEFIEGASLVLEIRPLASAEHAYTSAISLDGDRRRKLDLLLKEDAQD